MTSPDSNPIVIVDDDVATCKLLERQLQSAGFAVQAFTNAASAIGGISGMSSGTVIADWHMPEMTGLELCQAVRGLQEMQAIGNIYFLLLTASDSKDEVVKGFEAGVDDYLTKPYHTGELLARVRAGQRILALQNELIDRNVEVQKANAQMALLANKLELLANTDVLTRLPNRRFLFGKFHEAWESAHKEGQPLSVLMMDIDRFKSVNDTYGHAVGDVVLKHVANVIRKHSRRPDLCGRFGGEEFVVVVPNANAAQAAELAENLRREVAAEPVECDGNAISTSISCGVSENVIAEEQPDDLIRHADSMLYLAKEHGRNQTWIHDPSGTARRAGDGFTAPCATDSNAGPRSANSPVREQNRDKALQSAHADSDN